MAKGGHYRRQPEPCNDLVGLTLKFESDVRDIWPKDQGYDLRGAKTGAVSDSDTFSEQGRQHYKNAGHE